MAKDLKITTTYHQPTPEIPESIKIITDDMAEQRKLVIMQKIEEHGRMKWDDPDYQDRLAREIEVACDNGEVDFSSYFLFKEKWAAWARAHSVFQGAGRGSAGGSLLAYVLKITHLDPIEWDLPFERFLSVARIKRKKWTDIDSDWGYRDIVIAAMKQAYGDRYAQVSTHNTLKIKSAIKDASRVMLGLNSNDPMINSVCKTIENTPMGTKDRDFLLGYKDKEGIEHPAHLDENPTLKRFFEAHPDVYKMVLSLLGIPRSVGRHASAVIISDEPVSNTIPTCYIGGEPCTQYVASGENYVEKAGLIKFDELTVKAMKDVGDCIRLVQKQMGFETWQEELEFSGEKFTVTKGELSLEQLPTGPKGDPETSLLNIYDLPEVPEVFDMISRGDTKSVFQLESDAMTVFCKRVKPTLIAHISDIVALDRPGPLDALIEDGKTTMAEAYILRKQGKMPVAYTHPDLEPILKTTFGVFVYQEQLQRAFSDLAGYSAEDADYFREILAKKKKQEAETHFPTIREKLKSRGWTPEQTQVFINAVNAASQYSFNLAHSAAYALNAYICAFLKYFCPTEWWCAVLNNAAVDEIKEKGYDREVRDIFVMPHVNGAVNGFQLKQGRIYAPLYLLDGVGPGAAQAIQECRGAQDYASFIDFFDRAKHRAINSRVITQLILCGSFAGIDDSDPRKLLTAYYYLGRISGLKAGRGKRGQALIDAAAVYQSEHPSEALANIPEITISDILLEQRRVESLPIYRLDVHRACRATLERYIVYRPTGSAFRPDQSGNIPVLMDNQAVGSYFKQKDKPHKSAIWCGLLESAEPFSYEDKKTGERVTALKMQVTNNGDSVECILWPDTFKQLGSPIERGLLMVLGNIRQAREPGRYSLFVQDYQEIR